jgi:PAS domain S-box-containing protein
MHFMDAIESHTDDKNKETTRSALQDDGAHPFFPEPELMAAALKTSKIGVWCWDIASNRVTWSTNLEDIHRLPPASFDGTFAAFENDIHPDDRADVLASIQETMRSRKPHRVLYRLPPRPDQDERWIEAVGTVMVEDGETVRLVGTCRDVTDRVKLHRELRSRANQQEAVARLAEQALAESDLHKLFEEAAAAVATNLGVEFVKILELVPGDAELLLRAGVGWKEGHIGITHEITGRESQAGFTLASGRAVVVENLATETRFKTAPFVREHGVVSAMTAPISGRDGRAYGVLGAHTRTRRKFNEYEVSFLTAIANVVAGSIQRLQADQRQELMIRELRHRSGNLFAQLLALFSQTAKTSKNLAELVPKYEARVLAMANAHRLITEGGWKSASLLEVLNILLAPHLDRITFAGPNVFLEPDPTFGLSLAVHELATNAIKHGSLAQRNGVVEVTWTVDRTDRGLTLVLNWKERDGLPPKRTRRPGFGSRLITMVIERQLNGEVQQTFGPEGLDARLIVPLTHERWPSRIAPELPPQHIG